MYCITYEQVPAVPSLVELVQKLSAEVGLELRAILPAAELERGCHREGSIHG